MVEGDRITPQLTLERLLGKPGTSRIWVARDENLGKDVAVKVLDKPLPRHSPQFHRFQREAEVVAHIKSAHVVHVWAHGTTASGVPFLEMELLEGEDLARRIERDGPMSLHDVAKLVSQLSRGLGKAHTLGLVHRNVKPSNIFLVPVDGSFDAKVLDIGLSSGFEPAMGGRIPTGSKAEMAPPAHASPEQIFGVKEVDFRADLWAIAIVAYEALTGRTPFRAENIEAFSKVLEEGTFDPPSRIVPSIPASVDAWFAKALQRDPSARFGGAKDLADAFARAAGIDPHERLNRPSFAPPVAGGRVALHSVPDLGVGRISVTGLSAKDVAPEGVTVIAASPKSRSSSSVLMAVLVMIGLGTVIAGLMLMHR